MFRSTTKSSSGNGLGDIEFTQPLLTPAESDQGGSTTLFAVDDESDDSDDGGGHVEENARIIAPALRSTIASREADSDELDDSSRRNLETPIGFRRNSDQQMPLLVGLYDTSHSRRSLDASMPLRDRNGEEIHVDLEELAAKRTAGGGLIDSVANMANSILGAGIIGLPYAMKQAGFFTGLTLLVILCGVTDWTIRLIVRNAKMSGRHSYIDIMDHCFGSAGRAAVSIFQFAFAFGGMCAFGIIIGDTIPHVMRSAFPKLATMPVLHVLANRQFMIGLCTLCISYPLSLYRDIHKLARASGLALVGMLIIVISVSIEGPHAPPESKGDPAKRFTFIDGGIFQAIGVMSFAFVCHHNSLMIYGSLRTPTLDRFAKVTHISTFASLVCCSTLAISGYVAFTDKTQGNILNNFPETSTLINVARFCFGLNMFTTLPLELFVCREVIEDYFFSHESFNMQRHFFFTTVILFSAMVVALITCDLGVMLEITGGVSATALAFIFPAACYYRLLDKNLPWHHRSKLPSVLCVCFGFMVMIISLFLALAKAWTTEGSAKLCI
ncbi:amino acid transporter [Coprinopsis cinerea okayama7|uniref:Amino acid transporter n=1 Tax=Coprinopsis cinerea (strain Okayama-7 / 130 / ATCC MYA-4618 / FGSC 9003) TaxID=240176 RepID=A8N5W6_COPC7|nr:amino acid transporter [Coprinopsis cinerea okayama7\|eukprot:XP_001830261.2 amino acid transporter [Coprinopsis cinerea okayama7\